ncbi:PAP2 family protein [Lactiplantibacillus garii]|uniref:PAP2 family protein n=1 Tax=Lactiplantibacillus garii TaxID=2306423 RepID=A0A426D537_9LACO|nr:phosphatase PAP2 family protein [Lactiplantibacillus garii]RRK09797.1 PAP2 family protein [Lactiplantibacillus garii]
MTNRWHRRDTAMLLLFLFWLYWAYAVWSRTAWLVSFDHGVANWLHHTPAWFQSAMLTYTLFGNPHSMTVIIIVVTLILIIGRQTKSAVFFVVNAALLAAYGNYFIKQIIERPRPTAWRLTNIGGFSFPSGHATTTTVLIGSLLVIAYDLLQNSVVKRWLLGLGLVAIGLMMVSRVIVGVHYPSDVVGGAILGSLLLYVSTRLTTGHRTGQLHFKKRS